MKKLIIYLLLFPTVCSAQVLGVGIFKVGNSKTYILSEIKKTTGVDLVVYTDIMDEINAKKYSDKTESITSLDSKAFKKLKLPGITFDSLRQNIDINYYSISGISLKNIGFVFYNDSLIRLRCNGTDSIFTALKVKYNEPKLIVSKSTVKCINKLTGAFDLEETINKYSWNNADSNIQVDYFDGFKYDSKCEKKSILELIICDTNKWNATLAKSFQGTKIEASTLKDF